MRIDHTALYVRDLEGARAFFETYFGAKSNARYHNPQTGLETYFLTFAGGGRLEIMRRPDCKEAGKAPLRLGYAHLALSAGSREAVDEITRRLEKDGFPIVSGPRVTGDGYYESCVLDLEGNAVEIVA